MTGGLVLAAGAGVRFGGDQSKLLALVDGRPVLEWAVRAQCSVASLERVVVVVGSRADEVLAAVDFGRAEPVVCPDWEPRPVGIAALRAAGARRRGEGGRDARR